MTKDKLLTQQAICPMLPVLPQEPVYRKKLMDALHLLQAGVDKSCDPVFGWIHAVVSECARQGRLTPDDWSIYQTGEGNIVAHQDFLRIQDEFAELEEGRAGGNPILDWNGGEAIKALSGYIGQKNQFRVRHQALYAAALDKFPGQSRKIVTDTAAQFPHLIAEPNKNITTIIICIPWYADNELLWNQMRIGPDYIAGVPPWAKIHETGVVLSSRIFRKVDSGGHDYFAYAAVCAQNTIEMGQKLLLTAQHEGSHGIVDKIITYLLALDLDNPVREGIAGALGEDGRALEYTEISVTDLLDYCAPVDPDARKEIAYIAGSKFWEAIVNILQNRASSKEQAWIDIFHISLQSAVQIHKSDEFNDIDDNSKIAFFLNSVLAGLDIPLRELEAVYESLNIKPQG